MSHNIPAWHIVEEFWLQYDNVYTLVHAIPDCNLQPIRPPAPSKETSTWSPKEQTLLTT